MGGWDAWLGRSENAVDAVSAFTATALSATIDAAPRVYRDGDALPPLWSWMAHLPVAPMADIGTDGHQRRGGFLPPVPLERRMWAGSRVIFHTTGHVGEPLTKRSHIAAISQKDGRAGPMVFVTVRHELSGPKGPISTEDQDIVYLAIPDRFEPPPAIAPPPDPVARAEVLIDPVRLFRFSALTFNGHRIHYDRDYARDVERYPALVVHGPLQALVLMAFGQSLLTRETVSGFKFRGLRPAFDTAGLTLVGYRTDTGLDVMTVQDGGLCVTASLILTPA